MSNLQKNRMIPLEELTLMDRFLLSEAVEDQQFFEDLLSIIFGEKILLTTAPQTEKEIRANRELRKYVRLDVWGEDEHSIYNTEVQQKDTKNLPKRGRYYQALIDGKLLEVGNTDYNQLKRIYLITIAPFDLFGRQRYMYSFQMRCNEEPDLVLGDEAYRIFLNTRGTDVENISPELKSLLEFFEDPSEEVAKRSHSDRIMRMQQHVKSLKSNADVRVRFMNAWEEREYAKQEGRAEGLAEGRAEGERRMTALYALLKETSRLEDYGKAMEDTAFREQLYAELGL